MPFEEDLIEVETPERVELSFPIAGLGSRFTAILIDYFWIALIQLGIFLIGALLFGGLALINMYFATVGFGFYIIVTFIVSTGYFIYFEYAWNGQTPGKRSMNIRVMRYGGLPMNFASSMIRNLMRIVDMFLLSLAIGFLILFLSKLSQRAGDYAAGTFVVRDRTVTLKDLDKYLVPVTAGSAIMNSASDRRFDRLSDDDAHLIDTYMARRSELDPSHRLEMGTRIASNIRTKLALKSDDFGSDDMLIRTAYQALKTREGNW